VKNLGQDLPDRPAFVVRDPADTVLVSLSNEEVVLIARWFLAQAQAWEEEK
jgi:hypothetical protein